MTLWLYRWPNGDTSLVWAKTRIDAVELLDEVGGAEPDQLKPYRQPAAVHLVLDSTGDLELEQLDEQLDEHVAKEFYPILTEAQDRCMTKRDIADAVDTERKRVDYPEEPAKTEHGRELQQRMGISGRLADHWALKYADTGKHKQ